MRSDQRTHQQAGFILLVAMAFAAGIMALITVGTSRSLTERLAAERFIAKQQAFYLAEGGLDQAVARLRLDSDYTLLRTDYTELSPTLGGYSIQVQGRMDDPTLESNELRVTATGHHPSNNPNGAGYTSSRAQIVVTVTPLRFPDAVFGQNSVNVGENYYPGMVGYSHDEYGDALVDSYDSRLGSYSPERARDHGRIATNATTMTPGQLTIHHCGNVTYFEGAVPLEISPLENCTIETPVFVSSGVGVLQHSQVHGDVLVGPGADPVQTVLREPDATITGVLGNLPLLRDYPAIVFPNGLSRQTGINDNTGAIHTFPGGTYRFRLLAISGESQLVFTGPTTLYVDYIFLMGGRSVLTAASGNPQDLVLKVTAQRYNLMREYSRVNGIIYAPNLTFTIGDHAQVYGAVVAKDVSVMHDAQLHYDEALAEVPAGGETLTNAVKVKFWQQ